MGRTYKTKGTEKYARKRLVGKSQLEIQLKNQVRVDYIQFTQDTESRRVLVNSFMNVRGHF
jgi:hypothetical protein